MHAAAAVLASLALASAAPLIERPPQPYALVELSAPASRTTLRLLRRSSARLVSTSLHIWRLPSGGVAALRARGLVAASEADRKAVEFVHLSRGDPLIPQEWWLHTIGADVAEPPGPGVSVSVVDTGLDLTHPEFATRPDTTPLNQQVITGREDVHGTAVSSVVAAPSNGIGLVGVYPQARLQVWDFGPGSLADAIAGLDASTRHGRTVINFSAGFFGPPSVLLQRAVDRVIERGSVIVAAVGNERQNGNRPAIPATLPHVITVGATNQSETVAGFSSRSPSIDLAAPGQDIPVAVPTFYTPASPSFGPGYDLFDGTSFSAPLVAGAAAWIWTMRPELSNGQLADVLRDSARHIGRPGKNPDTGYGILNIPAALTTAPRSVDPQEPNDDIFDVRPFGVSASGHPLLTTPSQPQASLRASVDALKDPEDVYRLWLPGRSAVTVATRGTANVDLALWGPRTTTVFERGAALRRDLIGYSERLGTRIDVVTARNRSRQGHLIYADVFPGKHVVHAGYSLSVSTRALR